MKKMPLDIDKLNAKDPKVKYGFTKELINLGKNEPVLLYDHYDDWLELINSSNNILKWTGIDLIGYLSSVDVNDRTKAVMPLLFDLLHKGKLITCNHTIFALGLIGKNKPQYRATIIKELLAISKDVFETEECKSIAFGKVIIVLNDFIEIIRNDKNVLTFIKKAQQSTRSATKKKADKLMNKLDI